jgi:glutathione peroxidase
MTDFQSIPLKTIEGDEANLGAYAGKVLLIVNTASKCGLTPQYAGLEALYAKYKDKGFAVLGFPANNFAGQEPGNDAEIQSFCETTYSIDFPMFSKVSVAGDDKHPLFAALIAAQPTAQGSEVFRERLKGYGMTPNPEPEILWNFEKFLVGRDGDVAARFSPDMAPDDERIVTAVEQELQAGQ